jgi:hypothetical protein
MDGQFTEGSDPTLRFPELAGNVFVKALQVVFCERRV